MRILKLSFNFAVTAVVAVASMTISTFARSQSHELIVCGNNETRASIPSEDSWIGPIKKIIWERPDKKSGHDIVINFDKSSRVTSTTRKYREGPNKNYKDIYHTFSYSIDGLTTSTELNEINSDTNELVLRDFLEVSKISEGLFLIQSISEYPLKFKKEVRTTVMSEVILDDERTRQFCIQIGKVVDRKHIIADIYTKRQNISASTVFESQYPIVDVLSAREFINKLGTILPSTDPKYYEEPFGRKKVFNENGYDTYYNGKFEGRIDSNGRPLFFESEDGRLVYKFKNDSRGNWIEKRIEKVSSGSRSKILDSIEKRKIEYYE